MCIPRKVRVWNDPSIQISIFLSTRRLDKYSEICGCKEEPRKSGNELEQWWAKFVFCLKGAGKMHVVETKINQWINERSLAWNYKSLQGCCKNFASEEKLCVGGGYKTGSLRMVQHFPTKKGGRGSKFYLPSSNLKLMISTFLILTKYIITEKQLNGVSWTRWKYLIGNRPIFFVCLSASIRTLTRF